MSRVSVLGVGRMGGAVTRRLVAAEHEVTIWNRSERAARALADELDAPSLRVASSAARAVEGASFVIASFANGDVTTNVLASDDFVASLSPDAVVCDMGTSGVEVARRLDAWFRDHGRGFVDGPVSGSVATAALGQLLVLAAGEASSVDAFRPVFDAYAKKVTYLGAAGGGQAMKLAVNLIVHDVNAALSEALVLATRAGIDPSNAYDVFQDSVVGSAFVSYKRAAFLDDDVPVAMSLDLVNKDVDLILDAATSLDVRVPTTSAVSRAVKDACDAGLGAADMAALARFLGGSSS